MKNNRRSRAYHVKQRSCLIYRHIDAAMRTICLISCTSKRRLPVCIMKSMSHIDI